MKKHSIKQQLIDKHKELVENGAYLPAREILRLLTRKHIAVGLDDVSQVVETILEGVGLRPTYSRSFCTAYFKM